MLASQLVRSPKMNIRRLRWVGKPNMSCFVAAQSGLMGCCIRAACCTALWRVLCSAAVCHVLLMGWDWGNAMHAVRTQCPRSAHAVQSFVCR